MRFLKLGIYYATYLRDFYAKRGGLENRNYSLQHRELIADCFGSSEFWTSALNNLNYETLDLVANAEPAQKTWARENDFAFSEKNWFFEIAAEQIKKFLPDVLFVADYATFTPEFLRNIRRECPSIRLILGWCGAPFQNFGVMREWDIALSCVPELVAEFKKNGIESFHVNHAFAPRILKAIDIASKPEIDFAFIGSILKQSRFHIERERLLAYLVEHTNLQIWSDVKPEPDAPRRNFSMRGAARFIAGAPERLIKGLTRARKNSASEAGQLIDESILKRARAPVFGLEMFQKIRDSRVVFNQHIDISPVSASNMRLFETTGTGACLLTDWKENLPELFEPDVEVLTYRTPEECAEKVRYILDNEKLRRQIAEAGQCRTLRDHNFENRAARIDEIVRAFLNSAPN